MINFDLQDIDRANEDVDKLAETFSKKFDVRIREKDETIEQVTFTSCLVFQAFYRRLGTKPPWDVNTY